MEFKIKKEQKEFLRKMYKNAGKLTNNTRLPPLSFEEQTIFMSHDILKKLFQIGFLAVHVKKDLTPSPRTEQEPVQKQGIRNESECFLHCYAFEANVPLKLRECEKGIEVEALEKMDGKAIRSNMDKELLSYNPNFYNAFNRYGQSLTRVRWYDRGELEDYTIFQPVVSAQDIKDHGENRVSFLHTHPHSPKDFMPQSFRMRLFRMAPRLLPESLSNGDFAAMAHPESPYYHGVMGAFSLELGVFMEKARDKIKELGEDAFHKEGKQAGFLKVEYIQEVAKESANVCADEKSLESLYTKRGMPFVLVRYAPDRDALVVFTKLKIT